MSITLNGTETTVADALAAGTGKLVITGETINTALNGADLVYDIDDSEISNVATTVAPLTVNTAGNIISGSTFSNNINNGGHGGAIYVNSTAEGIDLTITGSLFDGNSTKISNPGKNDWYHGGAMYISAGEVRISGSTFSNNEGGDGGAIYVNSGSTLYLSNVIFDSNTARKSAAQASAQKYSGALCLADGSTLVIDGLVKFAGANDFTWKNSSAFIYLNCETLMAGDAKIAKAVDFADTAQATYFYTSWMNNDNDRYTLVKRAETGNDFYIVAAGTDFTTAIVTGQGDICQVTVNGTEYYGYDYADIASALASAYATIAVKDVIASGDITAAEKDLVIADSTVTGAVSVKSLNAENAAITGAITATSIQAKNLNVTGNIAAKMLNADGLTVTNGVLSYSADSTINNAAFASGSGTNGGAIYSASSCTLTVKNSTFTGNKASSNGGAIFAQNPDLILANLTFDGNQAAKGGAVYVAKSNVTVAGLLTFKQATDTFVINWNADLTIDTTELLKDKTFAKVMDFSNGSYLSNGSQQEVAFTETGVAMKSYNGDVYVIRDGAEISAVVAGENVNSVTIGGKVYQGPDFADVATAIASGLQTVAVKNYAFEGNTNVNSVDFVADGLTSSGGFLTVGNAEFVNSTFVNGTNSNHGGALSATVAGSVVTLTDCTFTGNSSNGNAGALRGNGANITLANVTFDGNRAGEGRVGGAAWFYGCNVTIAGLVSFKQSSDTVFLTDDTTVTIDSGKFLTDGVDMAKVLDFDNGATMNRTDLSSITCTGSDASFVKIGEDYYVVRNSVVDNGDKFEGDGSNLMTGGEVNNYFADKSGAKNITTTILGGKVESNLVGGAYVAAGNNATVNSVELLIGGTAEVAAKVYAGGYLYGNAGDAEAAAEAQLTVDEVNITIDGGAVSTNMYGGAHARQFGNASVTKVNITVTAGSHGRIYAGGWAEKGAVSSVGTANVIISGGSVDYLYGGGANADGTTTVGTTTITIENDAVVNTVFMSGRYGYSSVSDTVTLNYNSTTGMKRLSGVSSAGVDNAGNTVVNVLSNLTADVIDYVDKFVINENCTLTANDAFYLGNRLENGETDGFTIFDFSTDGLDKEWTAVAGISDFTNAKFAVNGEGLTTWDGKAAIAIDGYELTYDAKDKTIKLAQVNS